jgi:hypothetical protein
MKERGILMSSAMVLATLRDVDPKRQTRRLSGLKKINEHPDDFDLREVRRYDDGSWRAVFDTADEPCSVKSPYGGPGGRGLWVRESWRPRVAHACTDVCDCADILVTYAADRSEQYFHERNVDGEWCMPKAAKKGNVPGIFMPRWASRIDLEITELRAQRVQDLSEKDILAEGVTVPLASELTGVEWADIPTLFDAWRLVWIHINGEASWNANWWAWCISYRRTKPAQRRAA